MKRLILLSAGIFPVLSILNAAGMKGAYPLMQNTISSFALTPEYRQYLPTAVTLLILFLAASIYFLLVSIKHKRINQQIIDSMDVAVYLVNAEGYILRLLNSPDSGNESLRDIDKGRNTDLRQVLPDEQTYRQCCALVDEVLHTRRTRQVTTRVKICRGKSCLRLPALCTTTKACAGVCA